MSGEPDVSVVIPIKDRAALFATTVASLTAQTHPRWEAVVVDDGSSTAELQRIEALLRGDPRWRLLRRPGPRAGACACRNAGAAASRAPHVIFLDADDALAPGCLRRRLEILAAHPACEFAVFPTWRFREVPGDLAELWHPFTAEDDLDRFLRGPSAWQTAGPIWRRTALVRLGPWDERALSYQDWEFHVRALARRLPYLKVPEPDSYWRTSAPGSISHADRSRRYIFNRARILARTTFLLRECGQLTPARRRQLGGAFYRCAYRHGQRRNASRMLWRLGRQAGAVTRTEYALLAAGESLGPAARTVSHRLERLLYPWD
jgi:glycosyltransferase involved in cell wall biosynthesis